MLFDSILILGAIIGSSGILKFLAQINDRIIPVMGLIMMVISAGLIYWVHSETDGELGIKDIPDAIIRAIGNLT